VLTRLNLDRDRTPRIHRNGQYGPLPRVGLALASVHPDVVVSDVVVSVVVDLDSSRTAVVSQQTHVGTVGIIEPNGAATQTLAVAGGAVFDNTARGCLWDIGECGPGGACQRQAPGQQGSDGKPGDVGFPPE
jgi:hypothetical protein